MTRRMIDLSDQRGTQRSVRKYSGCLATSRSHVKKRGYGLPPSVRAVASSDNALLPRPTRVGSMCVCSSGWIDDVIAMPSL
jgi:hypothetical protein